VTARNAQHSLVLADDGIADPIAVEIAVRGTRTVALTPVERRLAVARILARGRHALAHLKAAARQRNHRPHAHGPMPGRDVRTKQAGEVVAA